MPVELTVFLTFAVLFSLSAGLIRLCAKLDMEEQ
jgi:hypothetical protein